MNKVCKIFLILLIVIFTISSYFFIKKLVENKRENSVFTNLQEVVTNNNDITSENQNIDTKNVMPSNLSIQNSYNLKSIIKINSDVIGWIKIDGTNIDYPVMQNGDFYLHKNIYKNYSSHGTPYLAQYCNLITSDNLIIYGHHMKDNSMFAQLENYKNYNFYKNHKYIKLYTIDNNNTIIENT